MLPETLGQILPRAARLYGDKVALNFEGQTRSFIDLDNESNRVANSFVGLGIRPGDRISVYCGNSIEWIISYYAALKCGAIINPINVMLTPGEVQFVANDCGSRLIVSSADKGDDLLAIKKNTPLENIVLFGGAKTGALSFADLVSSGRDSFDVIPRKADDISTIGYTSGTTGHPKGAMLTQRAVVLNSAMTANAHVRTSLDSVVTALPCAHVYGNVVMNGAFLTGMTLSLMPRFDPTIALNLIETHRPTMFEGVPTMFMYMLEEPTLAKRDLSSLTRCTVGGQTMPVSKMQAVEERFGCPLLELWGMTEIAGLGTTHPAYGKNKLGSIGIPLPYTECRIASVNKASETLPDNEVGELMVRGPIVMRGYFGNEKATKEAIESDGWLHTGDLAMRDGDGHIFVVDRRKDMIITGGYNIYPAEIERVVASHADVALVAVGGKPDSLKGEIAKAYVVLKPGLEGNAESILAHCRQHLAAYKVPRELQFVADLPKTSTGKIMRRELRKLDS